MGTVTSMQRGRLHRSAWKLSMQKLRTGNSVFLLDQCRRRRGWECFERALDFVLVLLQNSPVSRGARRVPPYEMGVSSMLPFNSPKIWVVFYSFPMFSTFFHHKMAYQVCCPSIPISFPMVSTFFHQKR